MASSCDIHWVLSVCVVLVTSWYTWSGATAADTHYESVAHRTSDDVFMNPCKARAFSGDIALSDEDVERYSRSIRHRRSTLEGKNEIDTLSKQQEYIASLVTARKDAFEIFCRHNDTLMSKMCLSTRDDVIDIRRRWRRLNTKLRGLQAESSRMETAAVEEIMEPPQPKGRHRRAATARRERLWEYGVVPYTIGGNFTGNNKALFQLAMRHWENHTCITFREKEPMDRNYITFTAQDCGCCSYVGKKGRGSQAISIGKNCDKFGIVVHELGHVIGFWHEHTRPDRDRHVQIMRSNIQLGQEYNFDKMTPKDIDSLGETYDFASIMHYSRNTFAKKNFLDTILPRRKPGIAVLPEIGQRIRLSEGDIRQANKLYKCPSCGRTLQESSAEFSHAPIRGKPELCQWRISATHGEKIVLNISMLNIPRSYSCKVDYLEVRDGPYVKSPLLGRFCGNRVPGAMESSGTRMWIEFKSRIGHGKGFKANYEAMCGGDISNDEGFLTSPNFPDDYRPNKNCVWKISVRQGFTVALKFQSFGIEKHDSCVYDYLEVRDGPTDNSTLIGNFCGYKIPEDIKSTGKDLFVKFVSDGNVQKTGFYAIFTKEFDECKTRDHGCDHICENTLGSYKCSCRVGYELHTDGKRCQDACGGVLEQENGTITSPSYPDLYPPDKNCVWQIVAPADHKIHINFTHLDLEGSNQECEYDSVRVSSGTGKQSKLHGVFCGKSPPSPVTSVGNKLQIEFNSDNSLQKTGFVATYQTDKDECSINNGGCQHECKNTVGSYYCACRNGFTLHDDGHGCKEGGCHYEVDSPKGTVLSPNYPDDYPSRKDCLWHFSTVPGHRIKLTFRTFQMEPHQDCTYDHIAIHDGGDREARMLGKFCGASKPKPVTSTSNEMLMTFFSDVSVERKGFLIEHDTVCGGDLFASRMAITFVSHPGYGDHNYGNGADCSWKIHARSGHVVQLEFNRFGLEDETECGYDAVEIFDGMNDIARPLGKYCGTTVPGNVTSSSQYLLIRFRSDDTISLKGFQASYRQVKLPSRSNKPVGKRTRKRKL